jgi:23S rRNA (cytosine1962-C5)-methyltransferase
LNETRPTLRLRPGEGRRLRAGSPWVFSNEIAMKPEYRQMAPGGRVRIEGDDGARFGTFMFNPHSLIAARLLDRDPDATIDLDWLRTRVGEAIALRERVCDSTFHRLVHAEADRLPGLVIDRYGDVAVVQANTAGMDRLTPIIIEALRGLLSPEAIVLRNDSPARAQEGLPLETAVALGAVADAVPIEENGTLFPADVLAGQKSGWFYDQRDNRAFIAGLAAGARVLDLYCHSGGFAVAAAHRGAAAVLGIDSSAPALALAAEAAGRNGVAERCTFRRGDVFAEAAALAGAGERFDIVIADPPAFAPSKRAAPAALRGYRKLARLAAQLTAPAGFLFLASCSYNVGIAEFAEAVRRGLGDAGRFARILRSTGASPDHPVHPALPESAYLKALILTVD